MPGTLVWFRRDLRLKDQPALHAALQRKQPLFPIYIFAPEEEAPWEPGAASRWWLHHSLTELQRSLQQHEMPLLLRRGSSLETLRTLVKECDADAVYWNRLYDPCLVNRDAEIKSALRQDGLEVRSFSASLLVEPWEVQTGNGDPYRVFSPFWKACKRLDICQTPLPHPIAVSESNHAIHSSPAVVSLPVESLGLLPNISWDQGFLRVWQPGEAGAHNKAERFLDKAVAHYAQNREIPGMQGTSQLSPHLHFGEISPRQLIWMLLTRGLDPDSGGAEHFVRELGWREFGHHLLYHYPHTTDAPLNPRFQSFPWRENEQELQAWQRGKTGIPIVDAAMRELWETGWMHNRARMIVGSFLTKNLRMHWIEGARWFWDTLVDADLAANTLGWQWAGGSGADAAPYFRIFNPVLQGERFDPQGSYVRKFVPELAHWQNKGIHAPWLATGKSTFPQQNSYPSPIVDLKTSREEALAAFATIKGK